MLLKVVVVASVSAAAAAIVNEIAQHKKVTFVVVHILAKCPIPLDSHTEFDPFQGNLFKHTMPTLFGLIASSSSTSSSLSERATQDCDIRSRNGG